MDRHGIERATRQLVVAEHPMLGRQAYQAEDLDRFGVEQRRKDRGRFTGCGEKRGLNWSGRIGAHDVLTCPDSSDQ
jgi:hypothetical protein